MRRFGCHLLYPLIAIALAMVPAIPVHAQGERVVLQLKWDHQFQFAGYYAALWQGYYEEAGFDVEIRPRVSPDGSMVNVMKELEEGRADFAVAGSDVLGARGEGVPVVILCSIFQRSPYALVSPEQVQLTKPEDLLGKRITHQTGTHASIELDAILKARDIDDSKIQKVPFTPGVDALLQGGIDVTMDYPSAALWRARELGVQVSLLYPSEFDLPFYGDSLVALQPAVDRDPERARRFRDATLRGWRYAMDHPEEVCQDIAKNLTRVLPCNDFAGYLRFEAEMVRAWMRYPEVEIGSTNSWRWASLYRKLQQSGVIQDKGSVGGLVLDAAQSPTSDTPRVLSFVLFLTGAVLALGLLILFLFTSWRHWLLPLAAAAILLVAIFLVDRAQHETRVQQQRLDISNRISALRAKLESAILADVQILHGLEAFVRLQPDFTEEQFQYFCASLTDLNSRMRAILAAPGLVVKHVYPPESNQPVLALDYRTHPTQSGAAMRAVELDRVVVAGPLELVQGGTGLVIRQPVKVETDGEEYLWGLVGVTLDFELLLAGTGLAALHQEYDIAIRGQDGVGADGAVFYGDPTVFNSDPVLQEVVFPAGSWVIAGAPRGGWATMHAPDWNVWAVGLLLLCLVLVMMVYRERQARESAENTERLAELEATRARAQALAKVSTLRHDFLGREITLSPEFCELLGLPAHETIIHEEEFLRFVRPADHERMRKLNQLARKSGNKLSFDLTLMRPDGKVRHVHLHSEIHFDRNKRAVAAFETVQDITERHEVQEALRQSEERFALAMAGSSDSLWDTDLRTGRVYYSPRFREMFALDPGQDMVDIAAGMSLVHPDDLRRIEKEVGEVLRGGHEKLEMEFRMITRDGRTLDVLARAYVARDENGRAMRMVGTIADVTPLKNAERESRQLYAQLQQAQKMEAIGHLAGGIAHDFNNILASILGFNELAMNGLRASATPERLERYMKEVEQSAMRARDLVRQLLSFSRPGGGSTQTIAIESVVADTLKMVRAMMPSTIGFDFESSEDNLYVLANPVQLNQVLLNLLINARDAMGESGTIGVYIGRQHAEGAVCASCHQHFDGEFVTVRVEDTGCGITEDQHDRIFEPFYTTKDPGKGTGMGLAVVHGNVHAMGGHVHVQSHPGDGTSVTIYMPHVPAKTVETAPVAEQPRLEQSGGGRILLAEDEDAVASFLSEALGQAGYHVTRCNNGGEAWGVFLKTPDDFDLLLTDQAMPVMNGSALSEKILKHSPGFPIILISGYSETMNEAVAADMGISLFLAKPVRLNVLLEAVARLVLEERPDEAFAVEQE